MCTRGGALRAIFNLVMIPRLFAVFLFTCTHVVGLYPIHLRVPEIVPSGVADVVITQAGVTGPSAPLPIN